MHARACVRERETKEELVNNSSSAFIEILCMDTSQIEAALVVAHNRRSLECCHVSYLKGIP